MSREENPDAQKKKAAPRPAAIQPSAGDIHRRLPHSAEMEAALIGSMMISPREIIPLAVEKTGPEFFYVPAHQTIFGVLVDLWNANQGQGIDLMTVTQALTDRGLLDTVGGASYVTSCFTMVPTAANVGYYIEDVRDKYVLREVIAVCTEGARRAYEEQGEPVSELVDEMQVKMTAIGLDRAVSSPVKEIGPVMVAVMEGMENDFKHKGRTTGLPTGIADLDRITMGLHPEQMTLLCARPSMGKTAFAMNVIENIAIDRWKDVDGETKKIWRGRPVLIFSVETSAERLMRRSVAARASVDLQDARLGQISRETLDRARQAAADFGAAPIWIDDSPSLKLHEFKARCRRYVVEHGIELIMVDYGQLMKAPSQKATFSRTLEMGDVSQGIKEVGRELKVATLVAMQLNREGERGKDPRPSMANIRESGQFEQDADGIWMLHRPEYYLNEDDEGWEEAQGKAELIVAKNKDGPKGKVDMIFHKEFTRFEGVTKDLYSNNPDRRQNV